MFQLADISMLVLFTIIAFIIINKLAFWLSVSSLAYFINSTWEIKCHQNHTEYSGAYMSKCAFEMYFCFHSFRLRIRRS